MEKVEGHWFGTVEGEDDFDGHLFDVVYVGEGRDYRFARAVAT